MPSQRDRIDIRHNNFDLLRLFAASQVAYIHIAENLQVELTGWLLTLKEALNYFPGVPIFFVISGFLISASLDRNPDLRNYAINRFLRIYPGLWVSTLVTLLLLLFFGNNVWHAINASGDNAFYIVSKWLGAQLTIGQFYNPHAIKSNYGVGHLNGSLWTIPVELQFYIVLPALAYMLWRGMSGRTQNIRLFSFCGLLYCASWFYQTHVSNLLDYSENLALIFKVSLIPYLYMFALGIIMQRNLDAVKNMLTGKGLFWLVVYLAIAWILKQAFDIRVGTNMPNLLSMTILAIAVISLAFTRPQISERALKGNDISYGTYVYHMIVANLAFELGYRGTTAALWIVLLVTYLIAIASWVVVEEPALRLKRHSLFSRRSKPLESVGKQAV